MPKNAAVEQDQLAGGTEMSTRSVTFGQIGDFIKGTYTNKKLVNDPNSPGQKKLIYELKGWLGQYHPVGADKKPTGEVVEVQPGAYFIVWGGKQDIEDLFARSKYGDVIAIQFKDEKPSQGKNRSPFKIFRCLHFGRDESWIGEDSQTEVVDVGESQ